jgi:hypothetical protein
MGRNRVDRGSAMLLAEAPSEDFMAGGSSNSVGVPRARHPWILGFQVDFATSEQDKD